MIGWHTAKIMDVVEPLTTVDPRKHPDKSFEYIDVSSVSRTTYSIDATSTLLGCDAPSRARRLVRTGDVLFATIRPTLQRITVVPDHLDQAVCSTGYFVLRPKPEVNGRFLFHYLFGQPFSDEMASRQRGASYPAVSDRDVKEHLMPLPPLLEQERIVAILDEAFAAIATATANAEKNLANVRELFESDINRVFSQKGDGWVEKELGDVCQNLDSRRVPITKSKRKVGKIPYYGASGIVDHVEDYLFDEDLLLVSEDGANLLARTYPIAFSISGKTWVNNHAHVLRFPNMAYQKLTEYYLNSISLKPYVSGMAQPKLNQEALNGIVVLWPKLVVQASVVVDRFEALKEKSSGILAAYQEKLALLADLKRSILHKAFTGELTADAKAADRSLAEAGV